MPTAAAVLAHAFVEIRSLVDNVCELQNASLSAIAYTL